MGKTHVKIWCGLFLCFAAAVILLNFASAPLAGGFVFSAPAHALAEEKININTADAKQLAELPGIGETLAGRIIAYRKEKGLFVTTEEIMEVRGIGPALYERIAGLICTEN